VSSPSLSSHVKGSAFTTRIKWLLLQGGESGLRRVQAQVEPAFAEVLGQGIRMAEWYPFEWYVQLSQVLDRLYGTGDLALVKELGRHGADANLTTIYRLFFKFGTVKWIIARAARLWGLHYDTGQLLLREFPGNEVELEISNFATPHRVHCLSVEGWAERAAELSGAENVVLETVSCRAFGHERCRFRLRWE
jgi:hypothetical protein